MKFSIEIDSNRTFVAGISSSLGHGQTYIFDHPWTCKAWNYSPCDQL